LLLRNASGLTQNCGNASHPQSRFAGQQAGKKSLVGMTLRPPFLFARLFFGFAKNLKRRRAIIYSYPCPALPLRGRQKGTPLMILLYFF